MKETKNPETAGIHDTVFIHKYMHDMKELTIQRQELKGYPQIRGSCT